MEIIQDAVAIDQEIEYNQQAMQDLIGQQTSRMQEGLDDEFDKLGEDELMDAIGEIDQKQTQKTVADGQKNVAEPQKGKKDTSFDDMMKELFV